MLVMKRELRTRFSDIHPFLGQKMDLETFDKLYVGLKVFSWRKSVCEEVTSWSSVVAKHYNWSLTTSLPVTSLPGCLE